MKIKFVDFWSGFNPQKNIFIDILNKKYKVLLSSDPDYIIYSYFGNEYLKYKCVRIFYTGENIIPDFNLCDYGIGFSYINFQDRYVRFPLYLFNIYEEDYNKALQKHINNQDILKEKNKFCNFIYSNRKAHPVRDKIFYAINEYKKVDSGGRHLNNIGESVRNKYAFQLKYKFSIACENATTAGYTTEKILQAFSAKTIPIYWGDPSIANEFNPKAFIDCHEYTSFNQVLNKIEELDNNDALYLKMINEPMFTKEQLMHQKNMQNDLEKFLYSIFDQPLEKAFRRERFFKGKQYENIIKRRLVIDMIVNLIKMIFKKIINIIKG
ncbi:hypothetical protein AN639_06765 [Candidatus Epulonipiscium fishelsonii]|uniref:Uncharacterized protein n=1 Tax=Candidatus Epulonipiscium fishelsonii TaxID=77094 RepID=A0ACC8X7P4_9FIRM|nr:hypothetical protein AN396_12220 [Epulopiscium sp. SCG-B11WGA-EpuloA1]ONI39035.1 hypothetical protein AN639_06765 [Epulopiscium sp. SCG-B05WGA-EpuloA1]